jgi:iron complex outermembrane receptor protein
LNFVSTGNSPLQWQAGLYWFQQHETQPVSAGATTGPIGGQAQLSTPINTPLAPEGPFTLPHDPLGNRWYDDRIRFNDTSLAAYGQVDYKITDELTLTGGLRFSYDKKYGEEMNRLVSFGILHGILAPEAFGGFALDLTPPAIGVIDYSPLPDRGVVHPPASYNTVPSAPGFADRLYNHSSNALTGTLKATWQPDDQTTAYAYYSRGYKGGGFNTGIFSFINPKPWVDPEHVNAYEIGLKKTFGEFLVLDAAAYYYDYSKMQVPVEIAATPGGVNAPEFINIPHAVSTGVEFEAFITPIEHMTAIVSYSYDEAHITSALVPSFNPATGLLSPAGISDPADPNGLAPGARPLFSTLTCANTQGTIAATCGVDIYTLNGTVNTVANGFGGVGTTAGACNGSAAACGFGWVIPQSLKGNRLPNTPKNKVAINLQYDLNIPELGTFTPSVTWRWLDKQFGTIFTRSYNAAPSWDQWDARVEFTSPDSHWNLIVYGKNLANKIGYAQGGIATRLSGSINTGGANSPGAGYCNGFIGAAVDTCNFVQGYTALAGKTPVPPGYGAIRGESIFGTTTNYNVNPPTLYGIQLQYRFD